MEDGTQEGGKQGDHVGSENGNGFSESHISTSDVKWNTSPPEGQD
jgi:hypothetical protein